MSDIKISNGRCRACDVEFGNRNPNEDLCPKCLPIAMQAAHGTLPSEDWYGLEDEEAMEKIMEAFDEYTLYAEAREHEL